MLESGDARQKPNGSVLNAQGTIGIDVVVTNDLQKELSQKSMDIRLKEIDIH